MLLGTAQGLQLVYLWAEAGMPKDAGDWIDCFIQHVFFFVLWLLTIKVWFCEED